MHPIHLDELDENVKIIFITPNSMIAAFKAYPTSHISTMETNQVLLIFGEVIISFTPFKTLENSGEKLLRSV